MGFSPSYVVAKTMLSQGRAEVHPTKRDRLWYSYSDRKSLPFMRHVIRVLFAIGSMGGGGSERQLARILRGLDRSRFLPMLYVVYHEGEFLEETPDDVSVFSFWNGRPQPRLYWPGRIHRLQIADLASVLRRQQVEVVYDRTYFMTLIAAPAARRANAARVSVIVNDPQLEFERAGERFAWIKKRLLTKAYRSADRVAAVADSVRASAIEYYGLRPERVVAIPNLLDLEGLERAAQAPAPELEKGRFHIVAAGRLHAAKGHLDLLAAMDELVHRR
jgi:glycosyltransferase involved in cell wall biosynthesis